MIQISAQMRVLVAIEPVDGRKGIDSLARLCQDKLAEDPFSGCVFVFRSRSGSAIRLLSYDGQGRISKDTSMSGTGFVAYYTYPSNAIATTVYFEFDHSDHQIDTLYLSNGNISKEKIYYPNDARTADSLEGNTQYNYSGLTNPAWHSAVANTIGPLLFILNYDDNGSVMDPISKNAFSKVSITDPGNPISYGISFNQQTDNKGRLTVLTPIGDPDPADKAIFNYY